MKIFRIILLMWLVSAVPNWCQTLGYFDHEFPMQDNTGVAMFMVLGGPCSLLVSSMLDHPYHWRFRPPSTEERWKAFEHRFGSESREVFEREYN